MGSFQQNAPSHSANVSSMTHPRSNFQQQSCWCRGLRRCCTTSRLALGQEAHAESSSSTHNTSRLSSQVDAERHGSYVHPTIPCKKDFVSAHPQIRSLPRASMHGLVLQLWPASFNYLITPSIVDVSCICMYTQQNTCHHSAQRKNSLERLALWAKGGAQH